MKGVYGFRFEGLEGVDPLLVEAPSDWQAVDIGQDVGRPATSTQMSPDECQVVLVGSRSAHIHRSPPSIRFRGATPLEVDSMVHPFLSAPISVLAHWLGMEPIHAGAFVAAERAWLIIAERSGGKSTTLSALADRGIDILSDDLSVVFADSVMAGPRLIDLRQPHEEGSNLGTVGNRQRWRRVLGPVEPTYRLGGYFTLRWDSEMHVERLSIAERLQALSKARAVQLRSEQPEELLRCATKPAWEIARPSDQVEADQTAGADQTASVLLELVQSSV